MSLGVWKSAFAVGVMLSMTPLAAGGSYQCVGCGNYANGYGAAACGDCGYGCGDCATVACAPTVVERTVMVPQWTTEPRTINCTEYRRETRTKIIQVRKAVPVQREVTKTYTVMVPEQHVKTVSYQVRVPIRREVEKQYTVMVPHTETRQGVRNVCQRVSEIVQKTVRVDRGHWEEQVIECGSCGTSSCGSCPSGCGTGYARGCFRTCGWRRRCLGRIGGYGSCGASSCGANSCGTGCGTWSCATTTTRRCWVPNIVEKTVNCTVWKNQIVRQPYEYTVCVRKPETHSKMVTVCDYEVQDRTKEVPYTVCVPQERTKTYTVTTCNYVTEPREVSYTVCVPYTVQKEVQVRVCHMVPKTITVSCGGCGSCGGCY